MYEKNGINFITNFIYPVYLWTEDGNNRVVTSAKDKFGIPGVTIVVKGSSEGTITDLVEACRITTSNEEDILIFSFVGMKPCHFKIVAIIN